MLLDQITSLGSRPAESACAFRASMHARGLFCQVASTADTIRLNDTEEHAHGLNPRN
jgi:hypothetical protein